MTVRDGFDDDEWRMVLGGPLLAGVAVTAADPGGLWGGLREGLALGGALRGGAAHGSALADAVIADLEEGAARAEVLDALKARTGGAGADAAARAAVADLAEIARLIDAKAPDVAAGYKAWLREIARKVAEAGTEGGFLGFGGVKVSEAEKAALADIDAALA